MATKAMKFFEFSTRESCCARDGSCRILVVGFDDGCGSETSEELGFFQAMVEFLVSTREKTFKDSPMMYRASRRQGNAANAEVQMSLLVPPRVARRQLSVCSVPLSELRHALHTLMVRFNFLTRVL